MKPAYHYVLAIPKLLLFLRFHVWCMEPSEGDEVCVKQLESIKNFDVKHFS